MTVLEQLASDDWAESLDAKTGRVYWYHKVTMETRWGVPTPDVDTFVEGVGLLPSRPAAIVSSDLPPPIRRSALSRPTPSLPAAPSSLPPPQRRRLPTFVPDLEPGGYNDPVEVVATVSTESPLVSEGLARRPAPALASRVASASNLPPRLPTPSLALPPRASAGPAPPQAYTPVGDTTTI